MRIRFRFYDTPHSLTSFDAPARETRFSKMSPRQLDEFINAGISACSKAARHEETAGDHRIITIHADFSEHAKRIAALNKRNAKFWEARK